ncbi:MAG: hypothetical protein IPK12_01685 [Gemmatimonadetes bacterium]|nr:hypothetical protein [Gemmatimonadota bacterium]
MGDTLASRGLSLFGLFYELSLDRLPCRDNLIPVVQSPVARDFCPGVNEVVLDTIDPQAATYRFASRRGDTLLVRTQGSTVLALSYQRHTEPSPYVCAGSGCLGAAIGGTVADPARVLTLAGTTVTNPQTGATATFTGTLNTADPAWQPPFLSCGPEGKYVVKRGDGVYQQSCGTLTASQRYGGTTVYSTGDFQNGWALQVVAQDTVVLAVIHDSLDQASGSFVPAFACVAPHCPAPSIGPANGLGQRTLDFGRGFLPGVDAAMAPTGLDSAEFRATLLADPLNGDGCCSRRCPARRPAPRLRTR